MNMDPRTPIEVRTARKTTGKRGLMRFGSASGINVRSSLVMSRMNQAMRSWSKLTREGVDDSLNLTQVTCQ